MPRKKPLKILAVIGTRPEAIKMAPILRLLRKDKDFSLRLCSTAQHRDLLDEALSSLGLRPHIDLNIMRPGQTPPEVLQKVFSRMSLVLKKESPDLLLVQGDTTSVAAAALAASCRGISVAHVEAGLRTSDMENPFPEEANRVLVDHLSALLFAPTRTAQRNLLREGIPPGKIYRTGNPGIDSLLWAMASHARKKPGCPAPSPFVMVTLHRRESFGVRLQTIFRTLLEAARRTPRLHWLYPVHPNPQVEVPARRILRHPRIILCSPLSYPDFVGFMKQALFIVTDSGGVQEEAPSLGKPVIVVRSKTERCEAAGPSCIIAGTARAPLLKALLRQASAKISPAGKKIANPFGDGKAAQRIHQGIRHWAFHEPRPSDFIG